MSRLVGHGRGRREGGFSFVELLVTIIIAGIAFAAMVPLFVSAQKATAADQLRNAALQLAQDKLEKIRALDYDLITVANLTNPGFMGGQFGTTVQWPTGGGNVRRFDVAYTVDLLPAGSQAGQERYKQVTVRVTWTAPPAPVKAAVLSTMVSKQYAGPQIVRFEIGPDAVLDRDPVTYAVTIISGPVTIDAYVAPDDIASMNQTASASSRGYVLFTVTQVNGAYKTTQKVTTPVGGSGARYQFVWDNAGLQSGTYLFQAVAVAGFGSRTQGQPVSLALQYDSGLAPPAPVIQTAEPRDRGAYIAWTTPVAPQLSHYEVWRSDAGGPYVRVAADVPVSVSSFTDSGLENGKTYAYRVRSVDTDGKVSQFSAPATVVPQVPPDTVPPSAPAGLTAVPVPGQPVIRLSWSPSTDYGTPASGVAGYVVQRSADGTSWSAITGVFPDLVYEDTSAGWGKTWYYRVSAVDVAGNQSAPSAVVSATTPPLPNRQIVVTNNSTTQMYVWVQNGVTGLWYATSGASSPTRPASGVWVKKNGGSVTWTGLPPGIYNVFFLTSQTWADANVKKTQAVDVSGGNGSAAYP